jgi:hypothetical protein
MRHLLHFGRSYSTEMLRNKTRLSAERGTGSGRSVAGRREIPVGNAGKDAFPPKATRIS